MQIKKKDLKVLIERLLFNDDKNSLNEMVQPNILSALALSYMVASTPASQYEKLALHVAAFIKVNLKEIISSLGVSLNEQQIKLCMLVAYGLTAIESGDAKALQTGKSGWDTYFIPLLTTDYTETLVSKLGISDTSIGITQLKTGTAIKILPDAFKKLVNFTGDPSEISGTSFAGDDAEVTGASGNHVRSTLLTFGIICLYAQKAIDMGYSFSEPGDPSWPKVKKKGDYRPKETLDRFESTGYSALDIAISAYNYGGGADKQNIFTDFGGLEQYKGTHYVPCIGNGCTTGDKRSSTYAYVAKVTKQMKGPKQRIIKFYDQVSLKDVEKSKQLILDKIDSKKERETTVKAKSNYPKNPNAAKNFRKWVNDNKSEELIALYEKEIPNIADKELSPDSSNNKSMHFWLAFEAFGDEWSKSKS